MKILPMYEPILNTYNVYGSIFSIIGNTDYLPWMYNHFIGIAINNYDETPYFTDHFSLLEYGNFSLCPWLKLEKPSNKEIIYMYYNFSIIDVIINAIEMDKYIWLYLDQYYISTSDAYQKKHMDHSFLVYGYDKIEQVFYIANNLSHGKFIKAKCSFELFVQAWKSEICHHYRRFFTYITKQEAEYVFDKSIVFNDINDYLESNKITHGVFWDQKPVDGPHSYVQDQNYWIFGQKFYEYLNVLIKQNNYIDIRVFHLLWEHKKCMHGRIKFLENTYDKSISERYKWIENHSKVLRNMALKYNITGGNALLNGISQGLEEIVEKETVILREFVTI